MLNLKKKAWKIDVKEVKECVTYKYFGIMLKSNSSFSEHIFRIKEKAHKAFFPLIAKRK